MQNNAREGQTVVRHFKPPRTIRLHIRKTMHKPFSPADIHFNACAPRIGAFQFPAELPCIAHALAEFAERVLLIFVPEHGLAKYQAKRHLIGQRLKGGTSASRAWKMDMRPGPEVAVPGSALLPPHTRPPTRPPTETLIHPEPRQRKR